MKKFIAVLLSALMALPLGVIGASAADNAPSPAVKASTDMESVFAEGENSLVVFVTGIGQSWSYLFDESYTEEGAFENGTLQDYENYAPLVAEEKFSERDNIFMTNIDFNTIIKLIKVVAEFLASSVMR